MEAPHFWLVYVIIWLYVLTPFMRYIVHNIPDTVLSGVIGAYLQFVHWTPIYHFTESTLCLALWWILMRALFYLDIFFLKNAAER